MRAKFINQLPIETQESILTDVHFALSKLNLPNEEYIEALENAMCSRLCDLEDTIDIEKYL